MRLLACASPESSLILSTCSSMCMLLIKRCFSQHLKGDFFSTISFQLSCFPCSHTPISLFASRSASDQKKQMKACLSRECKAQLFKINITTEVFFGSFSKITINHKMLRITFLNACKENNLLLGKV